MKHENEKVDIFDQEGNVTGTKKRSDIDKQTDVTHSAYVLVFSPEQEIVLSRIPANGLYAGRLGTTAATIIRHGEEPEAAARRALEKEMGLIDPMPSLLGTTFERFDDGVVQRVSAFICQQTGELEPNPADSLGVVRRTRVAIDASIDDPKLFTPTFQAIWRRYQERLPLA